MMLTRGLAYILFLVTIILFVVWDDITYGIWAIIFLMFARGGK